MSGLRLSLSVIRTGKRICVEGHDGMVAIKFPSAQKAQWAEEHLIETVGDIPSVKAGAVLTQVDTVVLAFNGVQVDQ